jgi:hypothetical protein
MRLYLVTTPILWCLANPKVDEREVAQALLEVDHHLVQPARSSWPTKAWRHAETTIVTI